MHISLTFKDFSTETNFLALQNKFAIQDTRANPYEPDVNVKVIKGDFIIIYKDVNPITYKEEYQKISFYNDFLYRAIDNLAKRYLQYLNIQFENQIFLKKENRRLFAVKETGRFNKLSEVLKTTDYLDDEIRVKLEIQIDIIIEHLSEIHIFPNDEIDEKLKFRMNRDVVLLLFVMLRERKDINAPYDSEFGKFIDENFLWWNEKEKVFKPFIRSGKVINDLKNGNKSFDKSLKKIKDLFSDATFYNFPNY